MKQEETRRRKRGRGETWVKRERLLPNEEVVHAHTVRGRNRRLPSGVKAIGPCLSVVGRAKRRVYFHFLASFRCAPTPYPTPGGLPCPPPAVLAPLSKSDDSTDCLPSSPPVPVIVPPTPSLLPQAKFFATLFFSCSSKAKFTFSR